MSDDTLTNESDTFEIGGTSVHRLGFGAMRLCGGAIIGPPDDEEHARKVLERAVELGIDFVDTADSYGPGVSERLIGETIGDRDDVLVATKAGLLRNREGDWIAHGKPEYIRNQVLVSLDRLRTETIDLYQIHRPDPDVPFEDSVATFAELQDDGLVDAIGLSNVSVDQLETAREHVDVATVQNRYNVGDRSNAAVLEACEDHGIGFIPWAPIDADDLAAHGGLIDTIAANYDVTRRQVALAWLLERSPVTCPIPGTSDPAHLEANVAASRLSLSDDEIQRLTDTAR
ncbi:aldo/keto reductase [Natronolimnohabitans sp. A-GB9]|uniref:aldo/keto reductase n=1 Tax=Natronolimnohabitans sp. A-GB9 TaxID=3069757 RepID=UPI0027B867F7|nr:aldo/keto reductase [Natronolimnohabitans sp. A-GB9]MDQ2050777.1 aldo/keto reductase [Natronolimnohabitans sp. A-GB9]